MFFEGGDERGYGIVAAVQRHRRDALSVLYFGHGVLEAHALQPASEGLSGLPDEQAGEGFLGHAQLPAPVRKPHRGVRRGEGVGAQFHQPVFAGHQQRRAHLLARLQPIHEHEAEAAALLGTEVGPEVVHGEDQFAEQGRHFDAVAAVEARQALEDRRVEKQGTVPRGFGHVPFVLEAGGTHVAR